LRSEEDRLAIIEGLKDGTIEVIATDHAPHSWEEKAAEFIYAPFGIVGLETAMGLTLTRLYHAKYLSLSQVIEKIAINPYRILNLPVPSVRKGNMANLTVFDPDSEWKFQLENSLSKSNNTPFANWKLTGKPHFVINNNQIFYSKL
jgi:dihydroorotase